MLFWEFNMPEGFGTGSMFETLGNVNGRFADKDSKRLRKQLFTGQTACCVGRVSVALTD